MGRNSSGANGFAFMYTLSSFTESMGVGESAYCMLALWNILRQHNPTSTNKLQRWLVFFFKASNNKTCQLVDPEMASENRNANQSR